MRAQLEQLGAVALAGMAVAVVVILLITPVGSPVLAGDVLLAGGQPKLLRLRADENVPTTSGMPAMFPY